jgi:hypothetical protein
MTTRKSLDGIISYLTKKHGGNVHEKRVVAMTASSVSRDYHSPQNAADFSTDSVFASDNAPGQWICWDFGEMRIRPTHYTIATGFLRSWVIEGSDDGIHWAELDRQTDNQAFKTGKSIAAFAVLRPAECRFVRLTQTGPRHGGDLTLRLGAVEFFGTLSE